METSGPSLKNKTIISGADLSILFETLQNMRYTIVGPTVRDKAIVYDELTTPDDLPVGWTDIQEGGVYHLRKRTDNAYFGYNVGPHSWKKFMFPPDLLLWKARRNENGVQIDNNAVQDEPKYAFLGVRACELHAIEIQDKIFMGQQHIDPVYHARRKEVLVIAVNCSQAGNTCFCTSMNTGPKVNSGFDLSLTEIIDDEQHHFLVEIGSEKGVEIMSKVPNRDAGTNDIEIAEQIIEATAHSMKRTIDTHDLKQLLYESHDSKVWEDVSKRCLSCGNCTMVCPTCFCSTVEDTVNLTRDVSERHRKWDSCFNLEFTYIHGGSIRSSVTSRYRQWMTHKLASWIDQFGTSGCVGCGRCITWCPVGIDITQEADALRKSLDQVKVNSDKGKEPG
jgi:formate hydrogenlyase subunit 6/NADH:ubiquinone oxidoreductase subunit I